MRGVGATGRSAAADKTLGGGRGRGESWSHEEEEGIWKRGELGEEIEMQGRRIDW